MFVLEAPTVIGNEAGQLMDEPIDFIENFFINLLRQHQRSIAQSVRLKAPVCGWTDFSVFLHPWVTGDRMWQAAVIVPSSGIRDIHPFGEPAETLLQALENADKVLHRNRTGGAS